MHAATTPARNEPFDRYIATGDEELLHDVLLTVGMLVHKRGWGLANTALGAATALCDLPVEVKLERYRRVCALLDEAFPMTDAQRHDLHGSHEGSLEHYLTGMQRIHP